MGKMQRASSAACLSPVRSSFSNPTVDMDSIANNLSRSARASMARSSGSAIASKPNHTIKVDKAYSFMQTRALRHSGVALSHYENAAAYTALAAQADNIRGTGRSTRRKKHSHEQLHHNISAHMQERQSQDSNISKQSIQFNKEDIASSEHHSLSIESEKSIWRSETHLPYGCYSPTCPCQNGPSGEASTWPHCKCYSISCRREHKQSYWKCPSLRKAVMRYRIRYALSATRRQEELVRPYVSFVPWVLRTHVVTMYNDLLTDPEDIACAQKSSGCILFADASGFTRLTEKLSALPNGAEQLCSILNNFFTNLVDIIHDHGGDIIKFAGDALLIVWTVGIGPKAIPTFREAVLLATQCSTVIHEKLHNYRAAIGDDNEELLLSLHMGIGCGTFTSLHLGGALQRMEYVIDGSPMQQIGLAEPMAEPGETVLSPQAWSMLRQNDAIGTSVMILHERACVKGAKRKAVVPNSKQSGFMRLDRLLVKLEKPQPTPSARLRSKHLPLLKRYIPRAVVRLLDAGHSGHLAEMREVSILFVKFDNFVLDANQLEGSTQESVDRGNALMLHIQRCVYLWEGSINKFIVDDKGLLVLCVFGLPPMKHADDPVRATGAAQLLVETTQRAVNSFQPAGIEESQRINCSVGVSTGHVFCGVVGAPSRREYTVMGRTVNLAARLMTVAKPNEVLVCEATRQRGRSSFEFQEQKHNLKGIGATNAYCPTTYKQNENKKKSDLQRMARRPEIERISGILSQVEGGETLVLMGDRGSGKSAVVEAAIELGHDHGYDVLKGHNKPEVAQPPSQILSEEEEDLKALASHFIAWSAIVKQLVESAAAKERMLPRDWVLKSLVQEDLPHAVLLNGLVPTLEVPEVDVQDCPLLQKPMNLSQPAGRLRALQCKPYRLLTLEQRITRVKEFIRRLVEVYAENEDVMIVLHLQTGTAKKRNESGSWILANGLARMCTQRHGPQYKHRILFLIATRSLVYDSPMDLVEIVSIAKQRNLLMHLRPLDQEARVTYLRRQIKANDVYPLPDVLVQYFDDMAAGNPKHIEELADQLLHFKAIRIDDDRRVHIECNDLSEIPLPDKMTGYVSSLLDRFQVRHSLVVKIASTCEYFTEAILRRIMPYREEIDHIPEVLSDLVDAGIFYEIRGDDIPKDVLSWDPSTPVCYAFCSKLFQMYAKTLLLAADRKEFEQNRNKVTLLHAVRNAIQLQMRTQQWIKDLCFNKCRSRSISLPNQDIVAMGYDKLLDEMIEDEQRQAESMGTDHDNLGEVEGPSKLIEEEREIKPKLEKNIQDLSTHQPEQKADSATSLLPISTLDCLKSQLTISLSPCSSQLSTHSNRATKMTQDYDAKNEEDEKYQSCRCAEQRKIYQGCDNRDTNTNDHDSICGRCDTRQDREGSCGLELSTSSLSMELRDQQLARKEMTPMETSVPPSPSYLFSSGAVTVADIHPLLNSFDTAIHGDESWRDPSATFKSSEDSIERSRLRTISNPVALSLPTRESVRRCYGERAKCAVHDCFSSKLKTSGRMKHVKGIPKLLNDKSNNSVNTSPQTERCHLLSSRMIIQEGKEEEGVEEMEQNRNENENEKQQQQRYYHHEANQLNHTELEHQEQSTIDSTRLNSSDGNNQEEKCSMTEAYRIPQNTQIFDGGVMQTDNHKCFTAAIRRRSWRFSLSEV